MGYGNKTPNMRLDFLVARQTFTFFCSNAGLGLLQVSVNEFYYRKIKLSFLIWPRNNTTTRTLAGLIILIFGLNQ